MAEARSVRIQARLDEVAQFASVVREEGRAAGFGETEVIELELAVVEATNNIIAHGYGGSSGEIEMQVLQDGGVRVELIDSGRPIPAGLLDNPPDVGLDAERGRGLAIIRSCVDYLDYSRREGANQLRLFKARA